MDHTRALNRIRNVDVLRVALKYAIYDRTHGDSFYDPFEIRDAVTNGETLIGELVEELRSPGQFLHSPTFHPRMIFAIDGSSIFPSKI